MNACRQAAITSFAVSSSAEEHSALHSFDVGRSGGHADIYSLSADSQPGVTEPDGRGEISDNDTAETLVINKVGRVEKYFTTYIISLEVVTFANRALTKNIAILPPSQRIIRKVRVLEVENIQYESNDQR